MKKAYKIIAALMGVMLALVLFITVMPGTVSAAETETVQVGDWTYTIKEGVAYIAKYNGTSSDVTIPTTVTIGAATYRIRTVGKYAFEGNKYIKNVVIPAAITTLEDGAFKNCTGLLSVIIEGNLANASNGSSSWNAEDSEVYSVFYNAGSVTDGFTVTFTDGVTDIPESLFATHVDVDDDMNCHVTQLVIADTVTTIGKAAFENCRELKDIQFGKGIKEICNYAFKNCASLECLSFDEKLETIGAEAFKDCSALNNVAFRDNLKSIGYSAFENDGELTELIFPDSVTQIENSAFKNCSGLRRIVLPHNNELYIRWSVFEGTVWLNRVEFNGDYDVYASAFRGAGAYETELVAIFTEGVTRIDSNTFDADDADRPCYITKVIIPSTMKEIGSCAFYNCPDLAEVVMDASLDAIGDSAFYGTSSLECIYIYNDKCKINDNEHTLDARTIIYGQVGSTAEEYAEKYNRNFCPINVTTATVTTEGVYVASLDRNGITAGLIASTDIPDTDLEYRWTAYNKTTDETILVQDWTDNNQWLNWKPAVFGEYVLTGEARVKYNKVSKAASSTDAFEYNPYIKGKCQMPYGMIAPGEPGYLIGIETYENPNQEYQYEMLILDCTTMQWVYSTGKFTVTEGAAGWCVWQPEYGYYWTLFRVYDKNGNMIDQACYGFENAY